MCMCRYSLRPKLTPTVFFRHDEVLANMGQIGRRFTEKYENQVREMTRSFLEYMKSNRQRMQLVAEADTNANADQLNSSEIRLTGIGFPVLPESVNDDGISKAACEKLVRMYLSQHYCKKPITSLATNIDWQGINFQT